MPLLFALLMLTAPRAELTDDTFAHWRDYVLPSQDELQWMRIGWRTTFWEAMQEGNAHDRPVLLWAMNGHPLGCT